MPILTIKYLPLNTLFRVVMYRCAQIQRLIYTDVLIYIDWLSQMAQW